MACFDLCSFTNFHKKKKKKKSHKLIEEIFELCNFGFFFSHMHKTHLFMSDWVNILRVLLVVFKFELLLPFPSEIWNVRWFSRNSTTSNVSYAYWKPHVLGVCITTIMRLAVWDSKKLARCSRNSNIWKSHVLCICTTPRTWLAIIPHFATPLPFLK